MGLALRAHVRFSEGRRGIDGLSGGQILHVGSVALSYALFFMTDGALEYLNKSKGWELGVGPSLVVADEGFGKKASTTTLKAEIYAFIFAQEGLMAGLGIEGSKITPIEP